VIREKLRVRNKPLKTSHIIVAVYSISAVENIIIAGGKMLRSEISSREFVDCVVANIIADVNNSSNQGIGLHMDNTGIDDFNQALDEGSTPALISTMLLKLKNITYDNEMRAKLQLSTMQRFQRIFTTCCNYPHCFNCQRAGHLLGETCREIQQKYTPDAQFCPDCQISVIKTDGCGTVNCVCGCDWEWQILDSDPGEVPNDDKWARSRYMVNEKESIADDDVDVAEEDTALSDTDEVRIAQASPRKYSCRVTCMECLSNDKSMKLEPCGHLQGIINKKVLAIDELLQSFVD
jgi:hypothetical protein